MNKFANWRSIRFSSWFDQVDPKVVDVPDEPVMKDINPRLQDMYMPPVEEEPKEGDERRVVEPTAFDLWSVHGSKLSVANWRKVSIRKQEPDPNQTSLLGDEVPVENNERKKSPLGEAFKFVTQPAKNVGYGDTCMNDMMTCQHGGKIRAGQPLVHVIDRNTNQVLFRFHPKDDVGDSCRENATTYLHDFIQRKPN